MSMTETKMHIRKCEETKMQNITFHLIVFGNQSMIAYCILKSTDVQTIDNASVLLCVVRPPNMKAAIETRHTVCVIWFGCITVAFETVAIMISQKAFAFWTILEFDLKTRIPCYIKNIFT